MTTQQKPTPMLEQGFRAYQRAMDEWKRHTLADQMAAAREALRCAHACQWQLMMALRTRFRVGVG
jgi:hypothetical protein